MLPCPLNGHYIVNSSEYFWSLHCIFSELLGKQCKLAESDHGDRATWRSRPKENLPMFLLRLPDQEFERRPGLKAAIGCREDDVGPTRVWRASSGTLEVERF